MAASDQPGGHDREPPGRPPRLVSDYFKPGRQEKVTSNEENEDDKSTSSGDSENLDLSSEAPRVTRSGRLIAPAQRRAGRRVTSRASSRAFSSRGDLTATSRVAGPSRIAESSRPPSSGSSRRPPAKRPQVAIDISSDSESEEAEAGPSTRPAKRFKTSSVIPRREPLSEADFENEEYAPDPTGLKEEKSVRPSATLFQNFETYNQDRVQRAFQGMQVELSNDLVSPRTEGIRQSLDVLLSLPKKYEYQHLVQSHQTTPQGPRATSRGKDTWNLMAKGSRRSELLMVGRLSQAEYTRQEATIICEAFIEILNRWPGNLNDITSPTARFRASTSQGSRLILACRHKQLPHKRIVCLTPSFLAAKPVSKDLINREPRFNSGIQVMDPTTYKIRVDQKVAGHRLLQNSSPIPELSDRYQFVKFDPSGDFKRVIIKQPPGPGQPPSFESLLPNEEDLPIDQAQRESLLRAERLLRLYSASITNQGGILDNAACNNIWTNLLEKYGCKVHRDKAAGRGTFGGYNLMRVNPTYDSFCTHIDPGLQVQKRLREDHGVELPKIIVRSTDRAWSLSIEQTISDTWLTEADILKAWTRGAEEADGVNQAIQSQEKPPSACSCTPEMSTIQSHPCARCGQSFICNQLVLSEFVSRRMCRPCNSHLMQRPPGGHLMEYIRSKLTHMLRMERLKSRGIITEAESALNLEECMKTIQEVWPNKEDISKANIPIGSAWPDRYSGKLQSLPLEITSRSRTQHDRPSVDATYPVWLTENGYRIHCPQNISLTLQGLNYAKHIQIPAYLAMVCWFTHERTRLEQKYLDDIHGPQARAELDSLETKMVKISKRLRIIRLTFGWTQNRRLKKKVKRNTQEDFDFDIAPCISGQPHPELQRSIERLDSRVNFIQSSGGRFNWPEAELARVRRVAEEIMDYFSVKLRRGNDGCPYFAHPESFPEKWNWNIALRLSSERLIRMRRLCNRQWPTYDTVETIFLECVFQACVVKCILDRNDVHYEQKRQLREKYKSILGLPISIAYYDGLTFAIGHREHGKGMFSGWPAKPVSLKERLDGDDENNMFVEPRTENYLKLDYDASVYPQLKKMIMEVDLPKEVYDKTHKPKDLSKQSLEEVMWNGEEVDEDLIQQAPGVFDSGLSWPGEEVLEPEGYGTPIGDTHKKSKTLEKNVSRCGLSEKAFGKMPVRTRSLESQAESVVEEPPMTEIEQKYAELLKHIEQHDLDASADLGLSTLLNNLRDAKDRGDEQGFMAVLAVLYAELE
ncbi:Ff.00g033100.m01.CDS01 [Fusarium sp. VM40]|nr:Ff.00g033100.m01.CDS01 [Fusarium sp. VM40]